jgi:hypothetical protein
LNLNLIAGNSSAMQQAATAVGVVGAFALWIIGAVLAAPGALIFWLGCKVANLTDPPCKPL